MHTVSMLVRQCLNPYAALTLMLALGLLLSALRRPRAGRLLTGIATVIMALLLLLPVDRWLAWPLEDIFPRPALPAHVDGILVLSGGAFPPVINSRQAYSWGPSALRLVTAANLHDRYPAARLIYSGGPGGGDEPGAAHVIFGLMGLPANAVTYEGHSLNTWQNLVFSKEIARPRPGETWLLVTSALHMPRAMGVARHLGWNMIAWPSDYLTPKAGTPAPPEYGDQLSNFNKVLHEWIGLAVYRLVHRTDALIPEPSGR